MHVLSKKIEFFEISFFLEDMADLLMRELESHRKTGIETPILRTLVKVFEVPNELVKFEGPEVPIPRDETMCILCNAIFGEFVNRRRVQGQSRDEIAAFAKEFCNALGIFPSRVCDGVIEINADIIVHIMDNRLDFDESHFCAFVFQSMNCDADMSGFEWSINVNPNQPPLTGDKDTSVPRGPNDIKIVQISDPHYDPNYEAGTSAVCGEPVCCRSDQPLAPDAPPENAAGYWGDYRDCDSPFRAVQDAFRHIRSQHDVNSIRILYFQKSYLLSFHRISITCISLEISLIMVSGERLSTGIELALVEYIPHSVKTLVEFLLIQLLEIMRLIQLMSSHPVTWMSLHCLLNGSMISLPMSGHIGFLLQPWKQFVEEDITPFSYDQDFV